VGNPQASVRTPQALLFSRPAAYLRRVVAEGIAPIRGGPVRVEQAPLGQDAHIGQRRLTYGPVTPPVA